MSVNTLSDVNIIKLYPLNCDSVLFSTYGKKLIDSKGDLKCQYSPPFPPSFDKSQARARICHACAARDHDSARKRIPTRERVSLGFHSRETCEEPPVEASAEVLGRSTPTPQVVGGSEPVPCNAKSLKNRGHVDPKTRGSLGVDHGKSRTGLAITFTGVAPRPLPVSSGRATGPYDTESRLCLLSVQLPVFSRAHIQTLPIDHTHHSAHSTGSMDWGPGFAEIARFRGSDFTGGLCRGEGEFALYSSIDLTDLAKTLKNPTQHTFMSKKGKKD